MKAGEPADKPLWADCPISHSPKFLSAARARDFSDTPNKILTGFEKLGYLLRNRPVSSESGARYCSNGAWNRLAGDPFTHLSARSGGTQGGRRLCPWSILSGASATRTGRRRSVRKVTTNTDDAIGHPNAADRDRRIGILGGTFDPPHIGHLWVARAVADALDLDVVWLLVAADPWQKAASKVVTAARHRLSMTEAACIGYADLIASDIEMRRNGPTYTVETLEYLRSEHGIERPYWIVGADAANRIDTWHRWESLDDLCHLVVTDRPQSKPAQPPLAHTAVAVDALDISSTTIRGRVGRGQTVDVLCPPGVVSLIDQLGLYRGIDG